MTAGESLLVLGAAGSVGRIATQVAVARGVRVLAAVRPSDFDAVRSLGADPIDYHDLSGRVDAALDASGRSDLSRVIEMAGGTSPVITLSDPRGPGLGVRLSNVVPAGVVPALREAMSRLAAGELALQQQVVVPLAEAADVHSRLEKGELRTKALLEI
ncbi:hypothetical protein AB0J83_37100 [Actinoplanes sp. NPDC049596]|uniref:hypothetical protein n=1 Tax=unclassified Actinoplanes TaxID=2626549 RepID=UPI00341FF555